MAAFRCAALLCLRYPSARCGILCDHVIYRIGISSAVLSGGRTVTVAWVAKLSADRVSVARAGGAHSALRGDFLSYFIV